MTIVASIYFGIGLVVAIIFSIIAYFDSDDSRYHLDMFVLSLMLFFLWPIGLCAMISNMLEVLCNNYKYNKERKRKDNNKEN